VRGFQSFFATSDIDLLITDYRLSTEQGKSNLSGADVIQHVRNARPDLPTILISAAPMFELEDACRDIPGVIILQKFFKMAQLLETIQAFST
jgi:CheY-like chemotaxis protein